MITQEEIKAAMDEHLAKLTPPEEYFHAKWYNENIYPWLNRQKVVALLMSMVESGTALKSEYQYDGSWYYKIVVN